MATERELTQHQIDLIVTYLRSLDYTVTPPPERPDPEVPWEEQEPEESVPFVAIGAGERAPWADLPLTCPTCGAGPLPLEESKHVSGDDTGLKLRFISHCGQSWMRGDIR